jgi:hypothetical protein
VTVPVAAPAAPAIATLSGGRIVALLMRPHGVTTLAAVTDPAAPFAVLEMEPASPVSAQVDLPSTVFATNVPESTDDNTYGFGEMAADAGPARIAIETTAIEASAAPRLRIFIRLCLSIQD